MSETKNHWEYMDPNSEHQLWSKWVFSIVEAGKFVPFPDVHHNIARWFKMGFGDVGVFKIDRNLYGWEITLFIEGPPAHDPEYVKSVEVGFDSFIQKGWGSMAFGDVKCKILAGDKQEGDPRDQMVVLPTIKTE